MVSAQAFWLSLELSHLCTSVGNVPSAQVVPEQLIIKSLFLFSFSLVPGLSAIIRVGTPEQVRFNYSRRLGHSLQTLRVSKCTHGMVSLDYDIGSSTNTLDSNAFEVHINGD